MKVGILKDLKEGRVVKPEEYKENKLEKRQGPDWLGFFDDL